MKKSAISLLLSLLLPLVLTGCGGTMQATQPVSEKAEVGTFYQNGAPRPGPRPVNPFSSSDDPENQSDDSQTADPQAPAPQDHEEDFIPRGLLTPTVYYKPIFNEDANACKDAEKVNLRGTRNEVLAQVCAKTKAECELQGSCMVQQNGAVTSYNFVDETKKGSPHFSKVNLQVCPFGLGVREACLDPFFNVAADMTFFKAGDVIFVPALVGLSLPDGTKHNGFLIVRDSGGGIEGNNRFDFFSGFYNWKDNENPFAKLKLTDKATKLPYYLVKGETAAKIKVDRNYPSLPGYQKGISPVSK